MATGTAVLDFGAAPGSDTATVAVTGQGAIATTSHVEAWVRPEATAAHSVDEHCMAQVDFFAADIVAATGFTIRGVARNGRLVGSFNVNWAWV